PVKGLLAETSPFLFVEFGGILSLTGGGQRGGAGGVVAVAVLEVVRQFGLGSEGVAVQASCRVVELPGLAGVDEVQALRRVPGLELPLEESRQLALQGGQFLRLADPLRRGVVRAGLLPPQFMAAPVGRQGLSEAALALQGLAQVAVRLGVL